MEKNENTIPRLPDGRTWAQALQDSFTPGHPDNARTPRFERADWNDDEEDEDY